MKRIILALAAICSLSMVVEGQPATAANILCYTQVYNVVPPQNAKGWCTNSPVNYRLRHICNTNAQRTGYSATFYGPWVSPGQNSWRACSTSFPYSQGRWLQLA